MEVAVSCGLLIAAGLMIRSQVQVKNISMRLRVHSILTAWSDLPPRASYPAAVVTLAAD